jgi:uncharacterized protein DUF5677
MKERRRESKKKCPDPQLFEKLKSFMDKVAVGGLGRNQLFSLCVKASVAKCYEFNLHVRRTSDAFFSLPSLRGICEDLIVLNYVKRLPRTDRENLIRLLMDHDVHSRIKSQDTFFSAVRPQQPVLRVKDVDAHITAVESKIRTIWNRHGWPRLQHGTMPQIRQIAEKQGQPVLASLYDYLYRLTSAGVHFNVQSLLRSGWGSSIDQCTFSTQNFDRYFAAYAKIYGAFLFCIYFEFFGRFLKPGSSITKTISEIRKAVFLESRWPEMVTFEEMNLPMPEDNFLGRIILSVMQAESNNRFIA